MMGMMVGCQRSNLHHHQFHHPPQEVGFYGEFPLACFVYLAIQQYISSNKIVNMCFVNFFFFSTGNGKIPEAPKLPKVLSSQKVTKFPKSLIGGSANKYHVNSPKSSSSSSAKNSLQKQPPAISARDELMLAIRTKGGVGGLRKVQL